MRKAIIGLGILLVTILIGLVAAPHLVDLERLKEPLAHELTARFGRPAVLAGRLDFSLLPGPSLTARDVRVANPLGAAVSDMVRLRALEVKLAFWPLLAGRFEIRAGRLVEPEIDIERLTDGSFNWPAAPSGLLERRGEAGAELVLSLDRLAIQNGAITYRAGASIERFEHISAEAVVEAATGTIRVAGQLVAHGATLNLTLRSGRLDGAEIPFQLALTASPETSLQLDALVAGKPGARRIDGKLKLTTPDVQAFLLRSARVALPGFLAQPGSLSGRLSGGAEALALDSLQIDLGPAHAEGRLRWGLAGVPEMALQLTLARLDLDHWPAARQAATPSSWLPRAHASEPASSPMHADWFGTMAASVELAVEALIWRGGLVQDARLKAMLAQGRWQLERLAAALPGGSEIALSGAAARGAEGIHSEGVVEINSDDLRRLAAWLGVKLDAVPPDRLRKASLSSRFAGQGERLDLEAIDATLDATRLSGAATILLRARPGIGLRLEADRLNLDAYWPQTAPGAGQAGAVDLRGLSGFDVNLDGRIEALTWHGQPMADVHLAGLLRDSEITVRELAVGDLAGTTGKLTGVLEGLSRGAPRGQLAFDMHGVALERLVRLFAPALAGRSYGAFSFGGGLQSDGAKITLDADLQVLDLRGHAGGEITLPAGAIDLGIDLEHPDLARLTRALAPDYQMAGDPGALRIAGHLSGDLSHAAIEGFTLAIGEARLAGRLALDRTGPRPRLDGELEGGDWRLDPFLPVRHTAARGEAVRRLEPVPSALHLAAAGESAATGVSAPHFADLALTLGGGSIALGRWRIDRPTLALALEDGVLSLQRLTGRFLDGDLAATARFPDTSPGEAKLSLGDADLKEVLQQLAGVSAIEGRLDIEATLSCADRCTSDPIGHITGDVTLHGRNGSIAGIDVKAINDRLDQPADVVALIRSGTSGHTPFSEVAGRLHLADGIVASDDLRLRLDGGDAMAMVRVDWPRQILTSRIDIHLASLPAAPPLVMRLEGAMAGPRVVLEANAFEQYLNQRRAAAAPQP
ncbi:MAG TPA: AsmA family protein [Stellaceae bacterium]|nr:AsmA family protein [Stellaceae bacterium]